MSNEFFTSVVSIVTALVGVAIVATVLSKNADTTKVIGAASSGFNSILQTALSPITSSGGLHFSANIGSGNIA